MHSLRPTPKNKPPLECHAEEPHGTLRDLLSVDGPPTKIVVLAEFLLLHAGPVSCCESGVTACINSGPRVNSIHEVLYSQPFGRSQLCCTMGRMVIVILAVFYRL